ncbi:hypothetical protein [Novosphingobium resinovorum]|nr:hypothetical protein [Novosphingobium resinovorum]
MFPSLSAIKWQIITGAAGLALLGVGGAWVAAQFENRSLAKRNGELTDLVDNPKTGLRVVLASERANRATVEAGLERQNAALSGQAADTAARLASTSAALAAAQQRTRAAEKQVAVLMATPIKGNTAAERFADVDALILEDLQ